MSVLLGKRNVIETTLNKVQKKEEYFLYKPVYKTFAALLAGLDETDLNHPKLKGLTFKIQI